jgi:hypothetical protein
VPLVPPARRRACLLVPLLLVGALLLGAPGPSPAAAADVPGPAYRPPVDGPVVEPFSPPATPYGPGNRGVDYAPAPGTPVRAAAAGRVVFAGPVAGSRHVTLLHPDGLRTSYSFLATVDVVLGAEVAAGAPVGTSGAELHFGVRSGDTYVDPLSVLASDLDRVHLVPNVPPSPGGHRSEGLALLSTALDHLSDGRLRTLAHYVEALDPRLRTQSVVTGVVAATTGPCTPEDDVPPPSVDRRIAVLVGGLGTTSERAAVDRIATDALGYASADVVRFSYAGGRTPDRPAAGALAAVPATSYGRSQSQGDLVEAGTRLRALLADIARRAPGVPIDVLAHSQGGVVTQIALVGLGGGAPIPAEVDLVATMGSPHDGADLATAVSALEQEPFGRDLLAGAGRALGVDLDPAAPAAGQLSETSSLMASLAAAPRPAGVRLLTIGARGDLTVPAGHTRLWDAPQAVVDLTGRDAHTDLPGSGATRRELALAIAGRPPTCTSVPDALADHGTAEAISLIEDALGFTAWRASLGP